MKKDIMKTSLIDLDETINIDEPKLIFLGGRPAMGKTTFAIDVASNICLKQDIPVLILSIEESKNSVINRIISKETKIDISKIRLNELNDIEKINVQEKRSFIEYSKIFIEDIGLQSIGRVIKLIRKYVIENNVKFIAIDYLQLMRDSIMTNIVAENILRQLKLISKELKITILITSQLSKNACSEDNFRPDINDIINKYAIQKYADVIMLLYQLKDFNIDSKKSNRVVECIIVKDNINKVIEVFLDGSNSCFHNVEIK